MSYVLSNGLNISMLSAKWYNRQVEFLSLKESSKFVPTQRFAGMQVIDIGGVMVGSVKDVSVDFQKKTLAFRVTTRNNTELDIEWDDILALKDVVLVKENVDLATSPPSTMPSTPTQPTGQAEVICPKCGSSTPARAKFCRSCGATIK